MDAVEPVVVEAVLANGYVRLSACDGDGNNGVLGAS